MAASQESFVFQVSPTWQAACAGSRVGVLVIRGIMDPNSVSRLEERKADLEKELRFRFAGQDRAALQQNAVLRSYDDYYRRFKKTYHVRLQLESIVFKGKSIPTVAPLVEAMFMAEMDNLLLTAGHDLDTVRSPIVLDVATGMESYVLLRGERQAPKAGDMMITDGQGIISSIVYGPDQRTQITARTQRALFTVYAPPGIDEGAVKHHLGRLLDNVRLAAPGAELGVLAVYSAPS